VWWPVDWQGGGPNTLSQKAQIEYVSTVADAYAAYGTPAALALAQQRLAAFDDKLPALFDAALIAYGEQPNGGEQVANLAALASALGVRVSALPTTAPTAVAAPVATAAPGAASEGGWNWAGILLGVVVLGMGGYLGWVLFKRLRTTTRQAPVNAPPTQTVSAPSITPYGSSAVPERTAPPAYAAAQAAATRVTPVQPPATAAAPPFEPEDPSLPPTPPPASPSARSSQAIAPSVAVSASHAFIGEPGASEEVVATPPASATTAVGQRPAAVTMGWMAGAGRIERYPVVDRVTTQFIAGTEDFHVTRNIMGPGGDYLGEFGVGVSDRFGMLNNDPEQVVAIDIYLFDKSDEKHMVTVNRALLSEYADTQRKTDWGRSWRNPRPRCNWRRASLSCSARSPMCATPTRASSRASTSIWS
jgi:hypothetical protein